MKRFLAAFLCAALICCMLLSGCTVDPAVTTTTNGNTTVGTQNGNYGLDLSGNDGWTVVSTSALYGAIEEDGYYYWDDCVLSYLDMNTGVSVVLCSDVLCTHETESCEAFLPDSATRQLMFCENDGLYYIELENDGSVVLKRRDSTGLGLQKVARLGEDLMGPDRELAVGDVVMTERWLYYVAEMYTVNRDESGGFVNTSDKAYLCRVDLKTGKDEALVEFAGGYLQLVTARADAMIYVSCDTPEVEYTYDDKGFPVLPDGYYQELQNSPANLMRWDESTGESTLLLERTHETLTAPKSYGGKVVFYASDNKYRYSYDLKTGEVSELDMIKGTIINETYMLHTESGAQYIKNMDTGTKYPIELLGGIIRLYNRSDKWLILCHVVNSDSQQCYYVPMSAIGDGIQAAELTPFPS